MKAIDLGFKILFLNEFTWISILYAGTCKHQERGLIPQAVYEF